MSFSGKNQCNGARAGCPCQQIPRPSIHPHNCLLLHGLLPNNVAPDITQMRREANVKLFTHRAKLHLNVCTREYEDEQ